MKIAVSTGHADPGPAEKAQTEYDRLGNPVQQRTDCNRGSAAGLLFLRRLLAAGPFAMTRAAAGQEHVGHHVDRGAGQKPSNGGPQPTGALGLVDQVEGQCGDQHTGTERHDSSHDQARHLDDPGDQRT
jgi:hypothetical protein